MLSKQQVDYFETFGFLKLSQLVTGKLDWIVEQFTLTFPDKGAGHDGARRTCIVPFIDQRMCTLLDDPDIEGIGASLCGEDFNYMGSDGNYYTGNTGWHRDGPHVDEKIKHIKIAFYLDELDCNSGALRVIPGSHRLKDRFGMDVGSKAGQSETLWNMSGDQLPAFSLDVTPGDVLVFDHNLLHSSWKGSNRRRMFTINVCERYGDEDLQHLRDYIAVNARFWIDRMYLDEMMNTASPQRLKHLEQVMDNDGHLAALSAKMRETMPEPSRG